MEWSKIISTVAPWIGTARSGYAGRRSNSAGSHARATTQRSENRVGVLAVGAAQQSPGVGTCYRFGFVG